MTDAPILYHCPMTRSETTLWLNEELGAPCRIDIVDIKKGAQKRPDFLAINPMGKVPTLTHEGVVVTEAAAICAYLADRHPDKGLAPDTADPSRGAYYRWMFFAPSCIEPTMMDMLSGSTPERPESAGHGRAEDVLKAVDAALENGPYLLGEKFSAADVVFGSTLNYALLFGGFDKKPLYAKYVERLMARPAAIRASEKNKAIAEELGWETS